MEKMSILFKSACIIMFLAFVSCTPASTFSEGESNEVTQASDIDSLGNGPNKAVGSSVYDGYGSQVMLQGFGWSSADGVNGTKWYQIISNNAGAIKTSFDWVWFPPPSDSASNEGYLPRQLNVLDSKYGTEAQLKATITAISPTKAIADIVVNHRVGMTNWADFTNPTWNTSSITNNDEYFYAGNPGASVSLRGAADTGSGYAAARDIDHTNSTVQSTIKTWMNSRLKAAGFVGWRYDYVKGFHGWHVGDYNSATGAQLSVGELWEDGAPQNSMDAWVNATNHDGGKSLIFDFATKNLLNNAMGWFKDSVENGVVQKEYTYYNNYPNLSILKNAYGVPAGYIGWKPENSVTFVDNHDTGSTQQHWELRNDKVEIAYVYLLTHPGMPCVAWDHFFDWGTAMQTHIKDLIAIRKSNGINMKSVVNIVKAVSNEYAAIIDGTIAIKIGPGMTYNPGTGWTVIKSGTDYCIWKKSTTPPPTGIRTVVFMFKETVVGQDIFVKGGHDAALVPSVFPSMSEPIIYNNTKNVTTAAIKANDASLDWGSESALDWTCPMGTAGQPLYSTSGYGQDPENTFGMHWWKFDVNMTGAKGDWFEFKAFMRQGSTEWWESDRAQAGTPNITINHWGKKGYMTKTRYNENWVEFVALP